MKRDSRAPPIVAIVLLLLPVLYVGSYLAMVKPSDCWFSSTASDSGGTQTQIYLHNYRYFGECPGFDALFDSTEEPPQAARIAPIIFWPLEQIDRQLRPGAWERIQLEKQGRGIRVLSPLIERVVRR